MTALPENPYNEDKRNHVEGGVQDMRWDRQRKLDKERDGRKDRNTRKDRETRK